MNHLISIRSNIIFSKYKDDKGDDQYNRFHELVFLVDKPIYRRSNSDEIIRERAVEEVRFTVSDNAFDKMMELLTKIKNAEPEEFT